MPIRVVDAMAKDAPKDQYCRHYARGKCTGCTRLHVPYDAQLKAKAEHVRAVLAPLLKGADPGAFRPIAASPRPMAYRTSVKWCLNEDREGRRAVGLYRQGSRDVVAVPDCPATDPAITAVVAKLFRQGLRTPGRLYDHRGRVFQRGRLKYLIVRFGPPRGLGAIVSHTGVPREDLAAWIHKAGLPHVTFYETRLTPGDRDALTGRDVRHLVGPELFPFALGGQAFSISPESFFQANFSLSGALVGEATAFDADGEVLLDLYGGFGAYAFQALKRFREIHVVDGNPAAAAAAARAAKDAGATHLAAHATTCERFVAGLKPESAAAVTHLLVNPPRSGLSREVTAALTDRFPKARELHYVSCNPETLARDLAALVAGGFKLVSVRPFDMFPQTEHVETVARLRRF